MAGAARHRTFLALDLDEPVRRRLAGLSRRVDVGRSNARWVSPANLHVTLKFLGDVEGGCLAEVCSSVRASVGRCRPFSFDVRGVQAIPPTGRVVRMLWADVSEPTGAMADLFAALESAMEPLSFAKEARPFSPHITLARVSSARDGAVLRTFAEAFAREDFGTASAQAVIVYTSVLQRDGPIYTPAARCPFR